MSKIVVGKNGYICLDDFKDWIDTSLVDTYSIKNKKDGTALIKFYDKNRKLVKPYAKKQ